MIDKRAEKLLNDKLLLAAEAISRKCTHKSVLGDTVELAPDLHILVATIEVWFSKNHLEIDYALVNRIKEELSASLLSRRSGK